MREIPLALLALCLLCLGTACPCRDHGAANVQSCQDWKVKMARKKCGETAFPTSIQCQSYKDLSCDIAAFFTCLEQNARCKTVLGVETTDTSGQAQCTKLASCQ